MWDDVIYKNMSPIERGQFNASVEKICLRRPSLLAMLRRLKIKKRKKDASTYSSTHMLDQLNEIAEIKIA